MVWWKAREPGPWTGDIARKGWHRRKSLPHGSAVPSRGQELCAGGHLSAIRVCRDNMQPRSGGGHTSCSLSGAGRKPAPAVPPRRRDLRQCLRSPPNARVPSGPIPTAEAHRSIGRPGIDRVGHRGAAQDCLDSFSGHPSPDAPGIRLCDSGWRREYPVRQQERARQQHDAYAELVDSSRHGSLRGSGPTAGKRERRTELNQRRGRRPGP